LTHRIEARTAHVSSGQGLTGGEPGHTPPFAFEFEELASSLPFGDRRVRYPGKKRSVAGTSRLYRLDPKPDASTGTTILKVVNGKIVEENGLDDGVSALTQLALLWSPTAPS